MERDPQQTTPETFVSSNYPSKMDIICTQIASKVQRQPYVEVSEVYLYIYSFI